MKVDDQSLTGFGENKFGSKLMEFVGEEDGTRLEKEDLHGLNSDNYFFNTFPMWIKTTATTEHRLTSHTIINSR